MMTLDDVVFDKSFLTIFLKAEHKLIHLRWKGFATSEQIREGFEFALEMVKEYRIENWLGNLKLMAHIGAQDEDWITQNWYPNLSATPLKRMALVTSLDFLNNAAITRIVNTVAGTQEFETRFFVDAGEAGSWLGS